MQPFVLVMRTTIYRTAIFNGSALNENDFFNLVRRIMFIISLCWVN